MSRMFLSAAAGAAAFACGAPEAAAQVYAGAGVAILDSMEPSSTATSYWGSFGRAGYRFNPFLSVEGEIYAHVTYGEDRYYGSNIYLPGLAYDVGLDEEYGAFVAGWIPIPFVGDLFARAGVVQTSVINTLSGSTENSSGYAFGGGAQLALWMVRLRGEVTRYELEETTINAYAATVLLQF